MRSPFPKIEPATSPGKTPRGVGAKRKGNQQGATGGVGVREGVRRKVLPVEQRSGAKSEAAKVKKRKRKRVKHSPTALELIRAAKAKQQNPRSAQALAIWEARRKRRAEEQAALIESGALLTSSLSKVDQDHLLGFIRARDARVLATGLLSTAERTEIVQLDELKAQQAVVDKLKKRLDRVKRIAGYATNLARLIARGLKKETSAVARRHMAVDVANAWEDVEQKQKIKRELFTEHSKAVERLESMKRSFSQLKSRTRRELLEGAPKTEAALREANYGL